MNKISEKLDVYQLVTNQIIELLERHKELNYTSTWTPANGDIFAFNPVTKTVYSGINQLLLSFSCIRKGYELNRWLTFKQIQELNASIKKGGRALGSNHVIILRKCHEVRLQEYLSGFTADKSYGFAFF